MTTARELAAAVRGGRASAVELAEAALAGAAAAPPLHAFPHVRDARGVRRAAVAEISRR